MRLQQHRIRQTPKPTPSEPKEASSKPRSGCQDASWFDIIPEGGEITGLRENTLETSADNTKHGTIREKEEHTVRYGAAGYLMERGQEEEGIQHSLIAEEIRERSQRRQDVIYQ